MYATTPKSGIAQEITPAAAPGSPTPAGGIRVPVCCVQVPAPVGSSCQSSPELSSKKLPVTGSATKLPSRTPTPFPLGTGGMAVTEPLELKRHSLFELPPVPPPYTATFLTELYSSTVW